MNDRNEDLGEACRTLPRMNKLERIGMGIQKMKEAMMAAGLREPTFEPNTFFRATFQRPPEYALKERKEGSEKLVERVCPKYVPVLGQSILPKPPRPPVIR